MRQLLLVNHISARSLLRSVCFALAVLCLPPMNVSSEPFDARGQQFIAFKSFGTFKKSPGKQPGEIILTSREIHSRIAWDELIASWNVEMPASAYLKIEARAIYPSHTTKWYVLGLWSGDPARHPRESVRRQKDADGNVDTDTLILREPTKCFQVRLTLGGAGREKPKLKFLGLSLTDTGAQRESLPPNRAAWGKTLAVPERSQMAY